MANTIVQDAVIALMFPKNWNKKKRNTPRSKMKYEALMNYPTK